MQWNYGLSPRSVFSPPDIRRKRVKSRMIYTDTLSAGPTLVVMVLHGVYPAVYTMPAPAQRVPAVRGGGFSATFTRARPRARKTPEKYNSTISGAYALESLRAIIHACRMLLPWQFPPTEHTRTQIGMRASRRYWPTMWAYMHVCADTDPCPRARECIGKYDITHGKVPGHLCHVNY